MPGCVHPKDHSKVGPTIHRNMYIVYDRLKEKMDLFRTGSEDFPTDAGVSKRRMIQRIPDQYKVALAPNAHIDKETAIMHETMRMA